MIKIPKLFPALRFLEIFYMSLHVFLSICSLDASDGLTEGETHTFPSGQTHTRQVF